MAFLRLCERVVYNGVDNRSDSADNNAVDSSETEQRNQN